MRSHDRLFLAPHPRRRLLLAPSRDALRLRPPYASWVPARRAGAAPAEGRPSNSRGVTPARRGGTPPPGAISKFPAARRPSPKSAGGAARSARGGPADSSRRTETPSADARDVPRGVPLGDRATRPGDVDKEEAEVGGTGGSAERFSDREIIDVPLLGGFSQ